MRLRTAPALAPIAVVLAACVAGCDRAQPPAAPLAGLQGDDARVEWRGTLPCADCEGIDTLLVLQRGGDAQRYDLVEVYLAEDGSARFDEGGRWRLEGAVLNLAPDTGGQRHYLIRRGGGLQASDAQGRTFTRRGDDVLQPAGMAHP